MFGTNVVVLGESNGWALIDIGGERRGWVSSQYLVTVRMRQLSKPLAAIADTLQHQPDQSVAGSEIRAAVVGSCDCPYDVKSNGAQCGGSSARSRPGGKSPVCYVGENASNTAGFPDKQSRKPNCSESGSCYSEISSATGHPKTVFVGEYYRKNGTYVRGYYRSK